MLNHAFAYRDSHVAQEAEMFLRQSVSKIDESRASWWGLGWALTMQGRHEEAVSVWRIVGGMADEFMLRGHQYRADGQYLAAIEWYKQAVEIEPQLADPLYFIGLSYEGLGLWQQAATVFHQGAELSPEQMGKSDFLYQIGWLQAQKLQPPDLVSALKNLDDALMRNQFKGAFQYSDALFQHADVLRRLGKTVEALAGYQEVIALAPDNYWSWAYIGHLLRVEGDAANRAEASFLQAIAINPQIEYAYFELGMLYTEMEQIGEAQAIYHRVLQIDPVNKRAIGALQTLKNKG
ncbi:MAG: tetratricopeptide repeat protein [Anaerolineales bacterium]|nr:tetratricopeptide repeat protein [Anaerolineales bacterium]